MTRFHYAKQDIVNCLRELGVERGDVLFSHISLMPLGFCHGDTVETFIEALKEVLGSEGTFLTPAYSYSFCDNEIFDTNVTKSKVGAFSNALLSKAFTQRSVDPIFSVVGFGKEIKSLFSNLPPTSFGADCLYERLLSRKAKVCNFGLSLFYFTPIHYLERLHQVPYRFDKTFSGQINDSQQKNAIEWQYYVRHLGNESLPDCSSLEAEGFKQGIVKRQQLGLGQVTITSLVPYFALASTLIEQNPWFLAKGPEKIFEEE